MPYSLYVVQLDPAVWERTKFRERNPARRDDKPCVYVGQTALTPNERFEQHKRGYKANRYVRDFGVRIRRRHLSPGEPFDTREDAEVAEQRLAERLRRRGYGVWWG